MYVCMYVCMNPVTLKLYRTHELVERRKQMWFICKYPD